MKGTYWTIFPSSASLVNGVWPMLDRKSWKGAPWTGAHHLASLTGSSGAHKSQLIRLTYLLDTVLRSVLRYACLTCFMFHTSESRKLFAKCQSTEGRSLFLLFLKSWSQSVVFDMLFLCLFSELCKQVQ
jgi:hypothetical protein